MIPIFAAIILFILCSGTSCKPKRAPVDKLLSERQGTAGRETVLDTHQVPDIKKIKLSDEFSIHVGEEEDFGDFKTYAFLEVLHQNKIIYTDSTEEYEFGDKLYPIVNRLRQNEYEVLIEINDRPSRNKLKYLKMEADKITVDKELPTFIAKASNLDNDRALESAGYWDYAQATDNQDKDVRKIAYNPIIYYEWTQDGLYLDSSLTIQKNTQIYGTFKGFDLVADTIFSGGQTKNFVEEVQKIERK